MRYITIALAKGRIEEKATLIFEKAGYDCTNLREDSRKLVLKDEKNMLELILVKPADVPTYVEYGIAQLGIVGKDVLLEEGRDVYEPLDLEYGKCSVTVAGLKDAKCGVKPHRRVATKYPNIASKYFGSIGMDVSIIKLSGSVELAPVTGLSDVIVDIVETGATLKENGLEVKEVIAEISVRVIVNKASMKMENSRIMEILKRLECARKELSL